MYHKVRVSMSFACRAAFAISLSVSLSLVGWAHASPVKVEPADTQSPKTANPNKTQYVIISFDGAHDLAQWRRSRALGERTGARFTYFLSCVFLLSKDLRQEYQPPGMGKGRSEVGFAQTKDEVSQRLDQIRGAASEGHEIASHGCGHFDGGKWTKSQWLEEFSAFKRIMTDAYSINGIAGEPPGWRDFAKNSVSGFRAPYLSVSPGLYEALKEAGFRYDASAVSRGPAQPQEESGTIRFALPRIPEGPKARRVIAMDYNLYVRHSGGFERPDEAAAFQERSYDAFKAAFDHEYSGDRVPLQLGFHFTLMNDGAYWRALEQFAEEVCVKADVVCTSYEDYLERTQPAGSQENLADG